MIWMPMSTWADMGACQGRQWPPRHGLTTALRTRADQWHVRKSLSIGLGHTTRGEEASREYGSDVAQPQVQPQDGFRGGH